MKYEFHSAAEAEFLEIVRYYESSVPGLGYAFTTQIESKLQWVCEQPGAGARVGALGLRVIRLRRFPFSVIYRATSDRVQVLAIAHERREPFYWVERA